MRKKKPVVVRQPDDAENNSTASVHSSNDDATLGDNGMGSAYALSLATREIEIRSSGTGSVPGTPRVPTAKLMVSASSVIAPEEVWAGVRQKSSLVASKFTSREWSQLQNEITPWLQSLVNKYREQDLKTIKTLCDDVALLSQPKQQSLHSEGLMISLNQANTIDVQSDIASYNDEFRSMKKLGVQSAQNRSQVYVSGDSNSTRTAGNSFLFVLGGFLVGVVAMLISCGIVLWQLAKFDLLKKNGT